MENEFNFDEVLTDVAKRLIEEFENPIGNDVKPFNLLPNFETVIDDEADNFRYDFSEPQMYVKIVLCAEIMGITQNQELKDLAKTVLVKVTKELWTIEKPTNEEWGENWVLGG